jgi:hypothetical protein
VRSLNAIEKRINELGNSADCQAAAVELVQLGEEVLEHWLIAHDQEPTDEVQEGFRLLALHRQGAKGDTTFNACRETCRELIYHYNLVTTEADHPETAQRALMMMMVARHLFLFISGKMESQELGDFCCSSKPLHVSSDTP